MLARSQYYNRKIETFKIKIRDDATIFILENLCEYEDLNEMSLTYFKSFSEGWDYINDSACVLDFVIDEIKKEYDNHEDPMNWYFMMTCNEIYDEVMEEYYDEVKGIVKEQFCTDISGNIMKFITMDD